ncbi:MAG: hypothetical protein ACRD2W_00680 [Acidimicrobiales bacterium]
MAALAVVVPASLAWACVAPMSLTTESNRVQPGGVVKVIGRETGPGAPIEIRLNAPNGRLLTTVRDQVGGMTAKWEWDVPIPTDIQYGTHVLYAVQNFRNMNAVVPRVTIYVGVEPPPAPTPEPRPASLDVGSGPSGMSLVLLGLGVAGAGLLIVGGLSVIAGSKKGPQPEAAKVNG